MLGNCKVLSDCPQSALRLRYIIHSHLQLQEPRPRRSEREVVRSHVWPLSHSLPPHHLPMY